ncbi:hypothetical protein CBU02nite_06180 [Clostridium butyricum]|uniref:RES domain-containing protein n=1 Tax=Clostridium butyricum TaxID=1492 RepID=A0A512TIN9_CLOBU|nr:RES family NAD+ phosphorylase [Clostridium butyricum]NOW23160.1 RES domain-containing protein [Clostridium butyricum]GEQ20112.1 hypothetical protein CBU02nite_06180 [Clostridium butyricum]
MSNNGYSECGCEAYITNNEHTKSKWDELVEQFKENRFFINKDLDIFVHFISGLPTVHIDEKNIFYRARKGIYTDKKDLDAPPVDKCNSGRLNPKGIQYLYVADSEDTSVSEVRPWIGSKITIVEISPNKKLKIIDFTCDDATNEGNNYRRIINENFSKPVLPEKSDVDYLPTQAIAEYIKKQGYDGIKYSSSIYKNGYNVVIFNANNMKVLAIKKTAIINNVTYSY